MLTDRVAWSVGQSVTLVRPAKTVEAIEIPFGWRTEVGPRNHVLDGDPDPTWEGAIVRGKVASHCKVQGHSACGHLGKTTEPIEVPLGF